MPAIPKPRPRALDKAKRLKAKQAVEDRENATVKARSGGQCEVREIKMMFEGVGPILYKRCTRRASEVHHFLGGIGRRGVKESALAQNKLHVCAGFAGSCHDLITRHVLVLSWDDVADRAGTHTAVRYR